MNNQTTIGRTFFPTLMVAAIFLWLPGFGNLGWGQTQTVTLSSSGNWTAPAGITAVRVECWGGGGYGSDISANKRGGGGGGGGAYASSVITVIPGNTYSYIVGAGGTAGIINGGNSSFNSTSVVAAGGTGAVNNATTAGAGGAAANSTGTIKFSGGDGANGDANGTYSGGGGGGAGSNGAGGNASGTTAGTGTALNGGAGGAGVNGDSNGMSGNVYGGGGSGSLRNGSSAHTGGSGAKGVIIISWCTSSASASIAYAGTPFCKTLATPQNVTLTGTSGGTFSATPAGLTLNSSTGAIIPSTSLAGAYTVTYTLPAAGACSAFSISTQVTIGTGEVWTGAVSSDWNVSGNWSCGLIPDLTTSVQIPNVANKPVLSNGAAGAANNIVINSGSSLTVSANKIQIAGTISNSGTWTVTTGTVEMKGSSAQSIGANVFVNNTIKSLIINNPAGVTLQGPLSISGIVLAQSGNLSSGGNLTLLSTATQTALIDGSGTGSISGNVNVQRYIPSAFGYKYLSSPFQDATVGTFSAYIDLGAAFPTFYKYDESRVSAGWVNYTDPAGLLVPMQGYAANFGALTPAKTINISGTVNNDILTALTLLNNNNPYTQGFNLAGNPYPSPIDWNAATGWTKTNIDNAIYYFDAGITDPYTGTYSSYINGASSDGVANNIIPAMQGFFVHVSNGTYPVTGALGMTNSVRINNLNPYFHKYARLDDRPLIRLSARFDQEGATADPTVIYFDDLGTAGFNQERDALKMLNTDGLVPNLYSVTANNEWLSIKGLAFPADSLTVIPLGLTIMQPGWVAFRASDIENLPDGMHVYLFDSETGMNQDMQNSLQYRVYLPAGEYTDRFRLKLSLIDLVEKPVTANGFLAFCSGDDLRIKLMLPADENAVLSVCNLMGQVVWHQDLSGMGYSEISQHLNTGIYVVSLYRTKGIQSQKVYIPYK